MKSRKPLRTKKAPWSTAGRESLSATKRIPYEEGPAPAPEGAARDNESIEDPLRDWPESSGDAEPQLEERRAHDEQREG